MAHSPHKRWKGCMLCKPHKIRGQGPAHRWPFRDLRQLGELRRVKR